MAIKTLRIERKIVVIDSRDVWERLDFELTVYTYDGQRETINDAYAPKGYALGLFICYVDDERVNPHVFDAALQSNGLTTTRYDIMHGGV